MIKLTRLDGEPFILNAEMIRYVESRPDTFVTLTTGERVLVSQSMDEVVDLAIAYQQRKHWMPMPVPKPLVSGGGASTPVVSQAS